MNYRGCIGKILSRSLHAAASAAFVFGIILVMALESPAAGTRLVAGEQSVKDMKTGLVWSLDANAAGDALSWDDAQDFIKVLNSRRFGGHADWRLPDINEFGKLLAAAEQAGGSDAAVRESFASILKRIGFKNVQEGEYWSSTTSLYNQSEAWSMGLKEGTKTTGNKMLYHFVWPVRQED